MLRSSHLAISQKHSATRDYVRGWVIKKKMLGRILEKILMAEYLMYFPKSIQLQCIILFRIYTE